MSGGDGKGVNIKRRKLTRETEGWSGGWKPVEIGIQGRSREQVVVHKPARNSIVAAHPQKRSFLCYELMLAYQFTGLRY